MRATTHWSGKREELVRTQEKKEGEAPTHWNAQSSGLVRVQEKVSQWMLINERDQREEEALGGMTVGVGAA